jgi:antitermination protein Q
MDAKFLAECRKKIPPEQMQTYVERRLEEWGHWYSRGNLHGLGYPPCSIEYRLMHEGIVRTQPAGHRAMPVNERAEEVEKLVQEMSLQNSSMALALRDYYFNYYSLRKQARAGGISHTQLKHLLDMAKQWVVGRLSGMISSSRAATTKFFVGY